LELGSIPAILGFGNCKHLVTSKSELLERFVYCIVLLAILQNQLIPDSYCLSSQLITSFAILYST